jgi:uncharacterized membrane protein YiaA
MNIFACYTGTLAYSEGMSNTTTTPSALVRSARAARAARAARDNAAHAATAARAAHAQGVAFILGVSLVCIGYFVALCFII